MEKYPLLQSQLGIFVHYMQYEDSTYYNLPFIIKLPSTIDDNRLAEAWKKLYELRPIFKTRFEISDEGEILQYCDKEMEIPIIIREDNYSELKNYVKEEFVRPFDLLGGEPLSRVEIVKTEEGSFLLWDIQHIIADYTSINKVVLQEDLSTLYEGNELTPEEHPIKEAVLAEKESFDSEKYKTSKNYFLNNFDKHSFPNLGNKVFTSPGKMIWAQEYIPIEEIDDWCQKYKTKPNILFQAVFAHVCSILFRKDDFAYWTIYHGRNDRRFMRTYGMFAKTIPIKNPQSKNSSALDYMKDIYDSMKESLTYSTYPSTHLCQELKVKPKLLFNFVAMKEVNYDVIIGENKSQLIHVKRDEANDALNVQIGLKDGNYEIRVEAGNSIFDEKQLNIIANLLKTALRNMMLLPDTNIKEIPLIPVEDKEMPLKLFELGRGEKLEIEDEDNIISAFKQKAMESPDDTAVHFMDKKYTYAQIDKISDIIADYLINEVKIEKGDIVGIFTSRCEKMVTFPLGIMKAGAAYLPLDGNLPQKRLEIMCDDAELKAIITEENTDLDKFKSFSDLIIKESEFNIEIDNLYIDDSDANLNNSNDSKGYRDLEYYKKEIKHEDLAVIIYTSGSTGKPKGVMISHGGIINFSRWLQEEVDLGPEDNVSAYASFGFDAHMIDIYSSLISGAQLHIIPDDIRQDILFLSDFLKESNITVGFFTTRIAHMLNYMPHNLRAILTGGEKIQPLDIKDYQLINGYGPTECTIYSTYYKTKGQYDGTVIGRPLPNYQLLIIDKNKNLVPQGVHGELLIAGKGLSLGYLNRPELNEEKFIDFNLTDDISLKAYRTGDLVRFNEDGNIVFLGREDKLIKLRGFRIELEEIEKIASYFSGVKEVAAKVNNDHLCLYYTAKMEISPDELKDYLSKYLPEYMIPSFYLQMESFPYNINSKIDRNLLPNISIKREESFEAPQGLYENAIANGFSFVLGLPDPISRNDEFSALGGDSITVMILVGVLRRYNIELSVKDVLDAQSVKEIAKRAKYKLSSDNINQEAYEGFVDSTPITQHFFESNFKNPSYFNQAFLFEADGRIDKDILKESMKAIINHHDLLRAEVRDDKLFVREIGDEDYFTIETCDTLDYAKETERINNEIDIENGEMIKLAIFEEESHDNLYIAIHHLIVDGVSWRIIIEDLNLAYAHLSNGEEVSLPEKTSSYQDYAAAIEKYREFEDVQNQKEYWEDIASSLKEMNHTKIDSHIRKMENFEFEFLNKRTMNLFNCSKYYNASINALFLSAISKSWNDVFGEDELSVRIERHGREKFNRNIILDRTVGWFTTAHPLILKCKGENKKEIISNIQKTLSSVPQKGFAYPVIMGIETEELPLLTFNYLGEMSKVRTGEMFVTMHRPDLAYYTSPENNYGSDVNINCYSINHKLHFNLEYNSEKFSKEEMIKFGDYLMKTFEEFFPSSEDKNFEDDIHIFSNHQDKKNLFLIHSANYGSEFFYYIAEQLKEDYSFSVLEPYNINHKENPLTSIEKMASKYIEIIKTIQPKGPYYIGGLCFGGAVAHEMALQLNEAGEEVEKLIIFDAHYLKDKELRKLVLGDQLLNARKYLKDGILNPSEKSMDDMVYNARLASKIWLDYEPKNYDGETIYFRAIIKPMGELSYVAEKMFNYVLSLKAGGYEGFYDEEKFHIIDTPVEHNNMFSSEGLEVIVPSIKKFIDGN